MTPRQFLNQLEAAERRREWLVSVAVRLLCVAAFVVVVGLAT